MMYGANEDVRPCVLHDFHSPITVINEEHHPFPQAWQRKLWGETVEDDTVSICATAHNSVHAAINHKVKYGDFPGWCRGKTRDLAQQAFDRFERAKEQNSVALQEVQLPEV